MRLAYTSQRTTPDILTGSELYIHALARKASASYEVTLAATLRRRVKEIADKMPGGQALHVERFPERRLPAMVSLTISMGLERSEPFFSAIDRFFSATEGFPHAVVSGFWSPKLLEFLQSGRFDLIHAAALPTGTLWAAWKASTSRRIPLVLTPFLHLGLRQFGLRYISTILRDARAVIAVTPTEARSLSRVGVRAERIHHVPLGIDVESFSSGNRERLRTSLGLNQDDLLVMIPRKAVEKGTFESLEAIRTLGKTHNHLAVLLLDRTPVNLVPRLHSSVERLRRDGIKVTDLGFLPHGSPTLRDAYAAADLLLQPSSTESFGLVYLEAWAVAVPVVAARYGAVPDVVEDGVNGLLTTYGSVDSIQHAVEQLLDNRPLAKMLGRAGYEKLVRSHTELSMWQATQKIYEQIVSGG